MSDRRAATMRRLRLRYIDGIPRKVESVRRFVEELGRDHGDAERRARSFCHQLAGSAGGYGFDTLSEIALELEHCEGDLVPGLERLLGALEQAHRRAVAELRRGVLVIEDDEDVIPLLQEAVREHTDDIVVARSAAEAESALAGGLMGMVLLDLVLPDLDGRDLLRQLRERPGTAQLPVVVLSAERAVRVKRECIDLGVDHFLEKPVDIGLLSSALGAALKRGATFEREARKDAITGLRNRAGLRESVAELQSLADRAELPLCVALIDLDHFKQVNDNYGHAVGDEVLRTVGDLIQRRLRLSDVAGRWGGEELVVVLPNTTPSGASIALRTLADALRESVFTHGGKTLTGVTFSAGIAQLERSADLDDAIDEADRRMYAAKRAGRGRVFGPNDDDDHREGPRVLLAEDDPDTARMIRAVLTAAEFDVTIARDGQAALEAAAETHFDGFVLDWQMPRRTGDEVLEALREQSAYARVPILMLTALGDEDHISRAFALGADDYVQKPFRPRELTARLRRLVAHQHTGT